MKEKCNIKLGNETVDPFELSYQISSAAKRRIQFGGFVSCTSYLESR